MTPEELRFLLVATGLSQQAMARLFNIGGRTVQGYALGEKPIPSTLAILLRALADGAISADEIRKYATPLLLLP